MPFFVLGQPTILDVSGPDSARYLNARLTNDVKSLKAGSGFQAAQLTPQGKAQGLFTVYRLAEEQFLLLCDEGNTVDIIAAFKKYLVADRVKVLELSSERQVAHIFTKPGETLPSPWQELLVEKEQVFQFSEHKEVMVALRKRTPALGLDLVGKASQISELLTQWEQVGIARINLEEARALRIEAGIPAFPEEINDTTLFAEAGLEAAISYKKGCYVGQEVMERVDSKGKVAKNLCHIFSEGEIEAKTVVVNSAAKEVGKVISAAKSCNGKWYGFASIRVEGLGDTKLTVGNNPIAIL